MLPDRSEKNTHMNKRFFISRFDPGQLLQRVFCLAWFPVALIEGRELQVEFIGLGGDIKSLFVE